MTKYKVEYVLRPAVDTDFWGLNEAGVKCYQWGREFWVRTDTGTFSMHLMSRDEYKQSLFTVWWGEGRIWVTDVPSWMARPVPVQS